MNSFEMQIVNGLKKEFEIKGNKHDKLIAKIAQQYIKGNITKNAMQESLACLA
jgi:hypothetical protein